MQARYSHWGSRKPRRKPCDQTKKGPGWRRMVESVSVARRNGWSESRWIKHIDINYHKLSYTQKASCTFRENYAEKHMWDCETHEWPNGPRRCSVNMPMHFFKARSIACRICRNCYWGSSMCYASTTCSWMFLVGARDTGLWSEHSTLACDACLLPRSSMNLSYFQETFLSSKATDPTAMFLRSSESLKRGLRRPALRLHWVWCFLSSSTSTLPWEGTPPAAWKQSPICCWTKNLATSVASGCSCPLAPWTIQGLVCVVWSLDIKVMVPWWSTMRPQHIYWSSAVGGGPCWQTVPSLFRSQAWNLSGLCNM